MKQFNKYGVALAVSAVAGTAVAQLDDTVRSDQNLGDAAIVPYYTTTGGKNTGVHVINTTDKTQVVKFRLRRGTDSRDALDFNIIMSPEDEWVGSIQADAETGVRVATDDTTCTAPAFSGTGAVKIAQMPSVYREGATEGYVEIIGMGQAQEGAAINGAAIHDDGVPVDCGEVESNFYRTSDAQHYTIDGADTLAGKNPGVHDSETTANDLKNSGLVSTVSQFDDTDDRALKVSWFIRDADGGLEVGGNAVHIEGFADEPMLTNQEALPFNASGQLLYDPFNFEMPNLNQGSFPTAATARLANHSGTPGQGDADRTLYNNVRETLGTSAVANDWSDKEVAAATVNTDWVVTLPGQYTMTDPVCAIYASYGEASAGPCSVTATVIADDNELPIFLLQDGSPQLSIWDREETVLQEESESGLSFSPSGSDRGSATLDNEVNVLAWSQDAATSGVLESDLQVVVTAPEGANSAGWAKLDITPENGAPRIFNMDSNGVDSDQGDAVLPRTGTTGGTSDTAFAYGSWNNPTGDTVVLGMAVWQRNFGANAAANYGRAVEHSYMVSSSDDQPYQSANR